MTFHMEAHAIFKHALVTQYSMLVVDSDYYFVHLIISLPAIIPTIIHCPPIEWNHPHQCEGFASQLVEILVNFNKSHQTVYNRPL